MMLRLWVACGVLVALGMVGGACRDSSSTAPTPEPTVALKPGPVEDSQEAESLRQLAYAYWDAFNSYDAVRALGYLEEDYRQQRDEAVREEIAMIQLFGVRLGVTEHTPPHVISDDEREMHMNMKEPLGTRRVRMAFRELDGEWKIIFAEEPE